MTAIALKRVVADALARVGADYANMDLPPGRPRTTTWVAGEGGLGIRHYASGRNVYIVQTRMAGRLRTVTIGPVSVVTRHQARSVARLVLAHALVGHDPAQARARIRTAPSFDDFLDEFWARWAPRWSAKVLSTNTSYRRLYLDGAFGDVFVDELDEARVAKWFADLNMQTSPGAANMTLALLSNMMNRTEEWGYRPEGSNPCKGMRYNRRRKIERFLSTAELARLGVVLERERACADEERSTVANAVLLLVLTGCRRSEVLSLQWGDVRGNRLRLRHGKTGPRTVWLGDEARAVIDAMPRRRGNPWVFWNARFGKPFKMIDHYWHRIRDEAGLGHLRVHDLRHTFASHAAMNKETLPMIGRLLGHANPQSTARYAHLDDEHVLDAAEQIGAAIKRMMGLSSTTE